MEALLLGDAVFFDEACVHDEVDELDRQIFILDGTEAALDGVPWYHTVGTERLDDF